MTVCVILAEKCYEEEQNTTEAYSLVTGVPIKDLNALEVKLMILMDYRLVIKEEEYSLLLQGNMNSLFSDSDDLD